MREEPSLAAVETSQEAKQEQQAMPSLRVYLLQGCRLEWVSVSAEQESLWSRSSGRALFILLLCAPNRQASRSQLAGILWPETDEEKARESLRSALKCVREVLRSGQGEDLLEARGDLLTLKRQEHLWLDIDAIAALVRQARNISTPHEALPLWERVRALLCEEFLIEERTSEWSQCRWIKACRQALHAARRTMIRALADFHVQSGQMAQAEELLHTHVIRFPTDQDALYRLMSLLIQTESFEEARTYYERCRIALADLGKQPAEHVKALAQECRSRPQKMIAAWKGEQRQLAASSSASMIQLSPAPSVAFTETISYGQETFVPYASGILVPSSVSIQRRLGEAEEVDWAVWFGLKLAQLLAGINDPCRQLHHCLALQERLNQELDLMRLHPDQATYTLSRRQALVTLAALSVALLMPFQQGQWSSSQVEQFLSRCTASLTACWQLLRGNEFPVVEEVLPQYLPALVTILRQSSAYRQIAAHLATQCHLLMSLLARHRGSLHSTQTDLQHCQQAVFYSEATGDTALAVAALKQLADTFYYSRCYVDMQAAYEKADHLIDSTQDSHEIPPLLRCRIYAGLADAYARNGQAEAAQRYLKFLHETFPAYLADDRQPLYADCGFHSLCLWEGLTLFDFGERTSHQNHYKQASMTFAKVEQFPKMPLIPERTRLEIIMHQAITAVKLRDMEQFCLYIAQGAEGTKTLGSQKRRRELIDAYTQGTNLWSHESKVQNLADVLLH